MEIKEKHFLPGGSGASWMKRWKEEMVAACEYCMILVMMEDGVPYPQVCEWITKLVWNNGNGYC